MAPLTTVETIEPQNKVTPQKRILVVDDHAAVLDSTTMMLKFSGFDVEAIHLNGSASPR